MSFLAEKRAYALLPSDDVPAPPTHQKPRRRILKRVVVGLYVLAFTVLIYRHELASFFASPAAPAAVPAGKHGKVMIGESEEETRRTLTRLLGIPEDVAGFWTNGIQQEKRITPKEAQDLFITIPNNTSAHSRSVLLATTPHRAGSEGDLITALHVLSHFQSAFSLPAPRDPPIYDAGSPASQSATLSSSAFGGQIHAWIDKYFPVMNEPLPGGQVIEAYSASGELLWAAPLEEIPLDGDIGGEYATTIGPWHGLSKNGSASGPLIYAGYGSPEELAAALSAARAQGLQTENCIALVQYGQLFRGLKVKAAEEAGCAACIIYSDPADDNGVTAPTYEEYPAGPARAPTAIQRGSVQYLSLYPGDPTTPGEPAYPNSTRLDGGNIPGIPSLPLSMANAEKLKEVGLAEGVTIKVVNKVYDHVMPIWNVMATIPGHIADEVVVIGNHRDAWVMGAADPISGSATVHEIVEGFSVLLKKGWKPLRTIVFASWDAEEYGLIGSTEWGEDFAAWIEAHVVAYLNVDVSTAGSRFHIGASPSLAHLVRSSAERVPHPTDKGRSLWDATKDFGPFTERPGFDSLDAVEASRFRDERVAWKDEEEEVRASVMARAESGLVGEEVGKAAYVGVGALGSGSDYTVFLQRIGVASTDGGFAATQSDSVYHYHSVYDSVTWMEKYGDPGYHRHAAVAKYLGLAALRVADAIVLPINTTQYAFELSYYLQKVEDIAAAGSFDFDFSALSDAISALQSSSVSLDDEKEEAEKELVKELKKYMSHHSPHHASGKCLRQRFLALRTWVKSVFGVKSDKPGPGHHRVPEKLIKAAKRVRAVNKQLSSFERAFISPAGLRHREWYRNVLVAPGLWLGYGATTFPGLTEAFTIDKDPVLAKAEAERLTELIEKAAAGLKVKTL